MIVAALLALGVDWVGQGLSMIVAAFLFPQWLYDHIAGVIGSPERGQSTEHFTMTARGDVPGYGAWSLGSGRAGALPGSLRQDVNKIQKNNIAG